MIRFIRGSMAAKYPALYSCICARRSHYGSSSGLYQGTLGQFRLSPAQYAYYNPLYAVVEDCNGNLLAAVELSPKTKVNGVMHDSQNYCNLRPEWNGTLEDLGDQICISTVDELIVALAGLMSALDLGGLQLSLHGNTIHRILERSKKLVFLDADQTLSISDQRASWHVKSNGYKKLLAKTEIDPLEIHLALANCELGGLGLSRQQFCA
ncbi:hypothetical protein SAMN04488005_1486 [Yoonia tamlensis]|uniref:Uncharacterized protein n=2 Tax=Yoonia tamlensis TaxID=390270 RepID=A0A1I6GE30_9RHOB|nr:hypothetical protein SAMN04488005_1486 [Yoonia tamlensis]